MTNLFRSCPNNSSDTPDQRERGVSRYRESSCSAIWRHGAVTALPPCYLSRGKRRSASEPQGRRQVPIERNLGTRLQREQSFGVRASRNPGQLPAPKQSRPRRHQHCRLRRDAALGLHEKLAASTASEPRRQRWSDGSDERPATCAFASEGRRSSLALPRERDRRLVQARAIPVARKAAQENAVLAALQQAL